jgi:hypothetical protein
LIVVTILLVRHAKNPKTVARASDADDVGELRQEVEALRGRVGSAEALGAVALGRATAPAPAPTAEEPAAPAANPAPQPIPAPPTPAQELANFRTYYGQIDALRGPPTDTVMAAKVESTIAAFDWKKLTDTAGPTTKNVACGNGYCRVSLTFSDLADAEAGRMGLTMAAGPMLGRFSAFLDPDTLKVEGYFTSEDKPFPAFPDPAAIANNGP